MRKISDEERDDLIEAFVEDAFTDYAYEQRRIKAQHAADPHFEGDRLPPPEPQYWLCGNLLHLMTPENTKIVQRGAGRKPSAHCRACRKDSLRRYKDRQKENA